MNRGFTLLEVLIAIAVLAISMLGVYRLAFMSIDTASYAKEKAFVNELGYQRVLETISYPDKDFKDSEKLDDGTEVKYTDEMQQAVYSGIYEMQLTTEARNVQTVYYYYEKR